MNIPFHLDLVCFSPWCHNIKKTAPKLERRICDDWTVSKNSFLYPTTTFNNTQTFGTNWFGLGCNGRDTKKKCCGASEVQLHIPELKWNPGISILPCTSHTQVRGFKKKRQWHELSKHHFGAPPTHNRNSSCFEPKSSVIVSLIRIATVRCRSIQRQHIPLGKPHHFHRDTAWRDSHLAPPACFLPKEPQSRPRR